jgi:Ras-related protein Rab-5C
MESKNN